MHRTFGCTVALILTLALPAPAQWNAALDVGGGLGRGVGEGWMRESRLAPVLEATGASWYLRGGGLLTERAGTIGLRAMHLDGAVSAPAFGPLRLSLQASAAPDSLGAALGVPAARATAAASLRFGRSGVWGGATPQRGRTPGIVVGLWRAVGDAIITVQRSGYTDPHQTVTITSVPVMDTSVIGDTVVIAPHMREDTTRHLSNRSWSDLQARVDWARNRWHLSATLGSRVNADTLSPRLWGRLHATFQASSRFAFIGSVGTIPLDPASRGSGVARFASLGVRLSPWGWRHSAPDDPLPAAVRASATAFRVQQLAADTVRIELRVPFARTVELAGDFNRWTPLALEQTSLHTWVVTMALARGTHRVSIRVNGDAWTAPPGLPSVEDEFNGRVGLLVVR